MTADVTQALYQRFRRIAAEYEQLQAGVRRRHDDDSEGHDFADDGSRAEARDFDDGLGLQLRRQLDQLAEAIARAEAGTYGLCERCGANIPAARLRVVPTATRCVGCARH